MTRPLLCALMVAIAGCSSPDSPTFFPDRCNIQIAQVSPNSTTLHPTDTLTLHASYTNGISTDCIPDIPAASLQWASTNDATASVDPGSGKVTAHTAGTVTVWVHAPGSGGVLGGGLVMVVTTP